MEAYSILDDLEGIGPQQQSYSALLKSAFARNKYLLKKYATKFHNASPRQFRHHVRLAVRQLRRERRAGFTQRYSSRQFQDIAAKKKRSLQLLLPLHQRLGQSHGSCKNMTRLPAFRSLDNLGQNHTKPDKPAAKMMKRMSGQALGWKVKKICLGEDLEKQCDQKLQSFLNNRYKSTLARLKNLYSNSKNSPNLTTRASYLVNHSLAGFIGKTLARH